MIPPVLRTARLVLRGHTEDDLGEAAAMWADPDVVRHIGGRPFTREEVWQRILRYRGHWTIKPYGYWAITDQVTGRFVGEIGLADWKRERLRDLDGLPETGWVLSPASHGHGYALEALSCVLKWADVEVATPTICIITSGNSPSIRLAERTGYTRLTNRVDADPETLRFIRDVGAGDLRLT